MKTVKKVLSLMMSLIILIATTPALQAEDSISLDMTQLEELQRDIAPSLVNMGNFNEEDEIDEEEIPSITQLQDRYEEAVQNFKDLEKKVKKENRKKYKKAKKYIEDTKQEVWERVNQYDEFKDFEEAEGKDIAFNTYLFELLKNDSSKAKEKPQGIFTNPAYKYNWTVVMGGLTCSFASVVVTSLFVELSVLETIVLGALYATLFGTFFAIFYPKTMGKGSVRVNWDRYKHSFTEKQFTALSYSYEQDRFASVYFSSNEAKRVLRDMIDILYYVSKNPTQENMMYIIYPHTFYWKKKDVSQRIDYLHDVAQLLRSEALDYNPA